MQKNSKSLMTSRPLTINILSLLISILFLTSCLAQPTTAPVEPLVVQNTQELAQTPIPTLTVSPTETPTLQPTIAPILSPTIMPILPSTNGAPTVVLFPTNGTYVDINDAIPQGSKKTYSISAMKGQLMTVSILPVVIGDEWGYFTMTVQTASGETLCPTEPNQDCSVWRGKLPATQDYLVTVSAPGESQNYIMRVAINPPGQSVQYFQYSNSQTGLSIVYPDSFVPARPVQGNSKITPDLSLHFVDSTLYAKTNLGEIYLMIGSSLDPLIVSTCVEPNQQGGGYEQMIDSQVINGINFYHSQADGAGAGNYYEQQIYRAVKGSACYEIVFYLHSSNIGNFPPDSGITHFDRDLILKTLYDVLATIQIK